MLTTVPRRLIVPVTLAFVLTLAPTAFAEESAARGDSTKWPSFRGSQASGTAGGDPPVTWNVETGENIRWSTEIPGLGLSSPVAWGDRLFLTTAVPKEEIESELKVGLYGDIGAADDMVPHTWHVIALDTQTGEIAWNRVAHEGVPAIKRHTKASHANSSPVTDGKHVVAFFGSEGLYCYDMDGKLLWSKSFGVLNSAFFMMPQAQWGFGSSPVIDDGKLIIQADVIKDGFLAVFDVHTGEEIWKVTREDFPTWSSPTVVDTGEGKQIVVNGFKHMGGYDFATGEALWRLAGGGDIPVPTPVAAHDLVYLTNAHGAKSPVYAIRYEGARGSIDLEEDTTKNEHIAWSVPRGGAYMQTPIVVGDELYVCRDNGVLTCFDAKTGEEHFKERLATGEGFTSSPVAAGGRLYFTSEMGRTHVIAAGPEFKELATNELDEIVMATPAIAGDTIYFRTRAHVVAIGETSAEEPAPPADPQP